jgi:hypothetical protein
MKRSHKVLLILAGIWLFAFVATWPELVAVWPQRAVVQKTFTNYSNALLHQDFAEAYGYNGPEFQQQISLDSFLEFQRNMQARFGTLKSVKQRSLEVRKWRRPSRWNATVVADFQYEKSTVRTTFELHRENDRWAIFKSSSQEQ